IEVHRLKGPGLIESICERCLMRELELRHVAAVNQRVIAIDNSRAFLLTTRGTPDSMKEQRWLRIIPVAQIMYTISYIDRTNVALALDPNISTMMRDLAMTDK